MGLRTGPESVLFPPIKISRAVLAYEQKSKSMNNGSKLKFSGTMGVVQTKEIQCKSQSEHISEVLYGGNIYYNKMEGKAERVSKSKEENLQSNPSINT